MCASNCWSGLALRRAVRAITKRREKFMKKSWRWAERRTIYSRSRRRTGVWEWWRIGKAIFRRRENLLKKLWQSAVSSTTNMESPSRLTFLESWRGRKATTRRRARSLRNLWKLSDSSATKKLWGQTLPISEQSLSVKAILRGASSNFAEGMAMAQKMGNNIHISFPLDIIGNKIFLQNQLYQLFGVVVEKLLANCVSHTRFPSPHLKSSLWLISMAL